MAGESADADRYTRRALALLRTVNAMEAENARELRSLAAEIRAVLGNAALGDLNRRALAALVREIADTIAESYAAMYETQATALAELAEIEAKWASGAGAAPRVASATAIDEAMSGLLVQGAPLRDQWVRQGGELAWRMANAVRTAATTPQPAQVAAQAIVGNARTLRGGLIEKARNDAAALIDTAAHTAAYAGRLATFAASGVNALEWFAILDSKTTIGCAVRAGKLYTLDFEPMGHVVPIERPPPRHWRCRSILLPHRFKDGPPPDGGPQRDSFATWLAKQPRDTQDELLGRGRADLWRGGKITLSDLIGQRGQTLTLAELRERA